MPKLHSVGVRPSFYFRFHSDLHLFLCKPQHEARSLASLRRSSWTECEARQGWVLRRAPPAEGSPCANLSVACPWAIQALPHALRIEGRAQRELGRKMSDAVVEALEGYQGHVSVHSFSPLSQAPLAHVQRMERRLLQYVKAADKSLWQRMIKQRKEGGVVPHPDQLQDALDSFNGTAVVQLLCDEDPQEVYLSVGTCYRDPLTGFQWPVPWLSGHLPTVHEFPAAPSKAWRKLSQSLMTLGTLPAPGEVCVDLGASPGGWSHLLASLPGVRVIAVDIVPLCSSVQARENVVSITHDASTWLPDGTVDWVFCDATILPSSSLAILSSWLRTSRCRRFVWALKFPARSAKVTFNDVWNACDTMFSEFPDVRWTVRHLPLFGHEIVLMGGFDVASSSSSS
eukprot:NODE_1518_length_1504_cov_28.714777_g1371_i0.p1 GENE.NODE_1518_length_1504_cov_28.714777_g1371_i0~~NODE_1518_length_1504_cov_28.714777_g1371_i0.p1  ORF type:complete len:419 (+),score=63.13 NODE_1518_length_1504_cov_28.714777_g1371_i0:64-1257(+)